jgi:hypothetical protein
LILKKSQGQDASGGRRVSGEWIGLQSYRHEARKPCLYLLRKHEQQQMIMIIIPTVIIINAKLNQHGNKKR